MTNYKINAVSISSVLKNILLVQRYQGTIVGVYERAVNIDIGPFLTTIIDLKQKNLPYGILCDFSEIDPQILLQCGDSVEIDSDGLHVNNRSFDIALTSASIWSPEFYMPIKVVDVPQIQKNIDLIYHQIIHENNPDGLVPLFKYLPNLMNSGTDVIGDSSILIKKSYEPLQVIIKAIRNSDEGLLITEYKHLTGLGIGLTPSGDDILTGLFATLIITSRRSYANWLMGLLEKILPQIKGLTNDISLSYHKAISQGYYPERFSNLIAATITGKSNADVQPILQDMLKWGQTSGYEITLGIIIGFLLSIENLEKL